MKFELFQKEQRSSKLCHVYRFEKILHVFRGRHFVLLQVRKNDINPLKRSEKHHLYRENPLHVLALISNTKKQNTKRAAGISETNWM